MKRAVIAACASALACAAVPSLAAQGGTHVGGRSEVFAGGELEGYLRSLQTLGEAGSYPWALRGFSPPELDRIALKVDGGYAVGTRETLHNLAKVDFQ